MKREDVIDWLEYLSEDARVKADSIVPTNIEIACKIAIEALKAQEPRVMTPDEVAALKRGEVVWYEQHTPDRDYIQPMVADGRGFIGNADLGVKLCYLGHCERLWTAEPTDEQREAVKWDE